MRFLIAAGGWAGETVGGGYKIATELAGYLAAEGHDVHYIAPSPAISVEPVIHRDGVTVRRYPAPHHAPPDPRNLHAHLSASRRLTEAVAREGRLDVIHGHQHLQFLGALRADPRPAPRRVFTLCSPLTQEAMAGRGLPLPSDGPAGPGRRPTLRERAALAVFRAIEGRVYRRAERIHAISAFARGEIERDFPRSTGDKVFDEPLWVDLSRFHPGAGRRRARSALGGPWKTDGPIVFTLRRLVPRMGLDRLLEAAALLHRAGLTARLLIGGDGPERADLQRLAAGILPAGAVSFLGHVPDAELPDCYRAADCFVLPTRSLECFGLIVLEAYACGTPVIATPIGAIPEVTGEAGRRGLTRDASAVAIAERVSEFLRGRLVFDPRDLRRHAEAFDIATRARAILQRLLE